MDTRQTFAQWVKDTGLPSWGERPKHLPPRRNLPKDINKVLRATSHTRMDIPLENTKEYFRKVFAGEYKPLDYQWVLSKKYPEEGNEEKNLKAMIGYLQTTEFAPSYRIIELSENPDFQRKIEKLAKASNIKSPKKLVVLESDMSNAFVDPIVHPEVVFVTSTAMNLPEFAWEGLITHEMGHIANPYIPAVPLGEFIADKKSVMALDNVNPLCNALYNLEYKNDRAGDHLSQLFFYMRHCARGTVYEKKLAAIDLMARSPSQKGPTHPLTRDREAAMTLWKSGEGRQKWLDFIVASRRVQSGYRDTFPDH